MGTMKGISKDQIRRVVAGDHSTLAECKRVINLDTFEGFTDNFLKLAIVFLKKRCPKDKALYDELLTVQDMCKNKEQDYIKFSRICIRKSISDLELELNREFYLDLISFLIYQEMLEGN